MTDSSRRVRMNRARVDLLEAVANIYRDHDLTPTEMASVLTEEVQNQLWSALKHSHRARRKEPE